MNKTTEALKLAEEAVNRVIETLEYLKTIGIHPDALAPAIRAQKKALTAIRESLAEPVKQEPVAEVDTDSFGCINWLKTCPDNGTKLYAAPVDAKAIRECRNPKADEVRAYRDEHSVSMKHAYEKVKLELNAKAEKAGIKFTGGFVRVAEFVTEDELLELSKAIRAEALEEAAKWLAESGLIGSNDCAAAIRARGLK